MPKIMLKETLQVGDPWTGVEQGPQIDKESFDKVFLSTFSPIHIVAAVTVKPSSSLTSSA